MSILLHRDKKLHAELRSANDAVRCLLQPPVLRKDSSEENSLTTRLHGGLPALTAGSDGVQSPGVRGIPVKIRQMMAILDECLIGPADSPDDRSALAWIMQSLEDIEATLTGLAHSQQMTDSSHLPAVPVYELTDQGAVRISPQILKKSAAAM